MNFYTEYTRQQYSNSPGEQMYFDDSPAELFSKFKRQSLLKSSIQSKFILVCLVIIVVMAISISTTYFVMIKRDKQLESQQRIQVAFDMLIHDIVSQIGIFRRGIEEFLKESKAIQGATLTYDQNMGLPQQNTEEIMLSIARSYLLDVTDELKKLAHTVSIDRLVLYGTDASIMALYQQDGDQEHTGISTISELGNQTYLSLKDSKQTALMLAGVEPIPDNLFPFGVPTHFFGLVPEHTSVNFLNEGRKLGIRVTVPIKHEDTIIGVMLGDKFFTQEWIEQYATLSQTDINLFIGSQLSIGSFPAQQEPLDHVSGALDPHGIDDLIHEVKTTHEMELFQVELQDEAYYQGGYAIRDQNGMTNLLTISVSKELEKREIFRVLMAVLTISGLAMAAAFGLSIMLSRKSMHAIHYLVNVIGAAADGNLRHTAPVMSRDEFGLLAVKLNEMIVRLRDVSMQTQAVSQTVNVTADEILSEFEQLFGLMEQQSASVDITTEAVERIDSFIDEVVANLDDVLQVTEQMLNLIRAMSSNTEEVAKSTGHLNHNLEDISEFIDQVSTASKQILANADRLVATVRETETEIQQIGDLLLNVTRNADQSKQLAEETAQAALDGQTSVNRSIQGIHSLKELVTEFARIMDDVNTRSRQVSSFLDVVDDITEKTTLLSLNASIISAQAGVHGRGFAVVADEIRDLSAQTKDSTREISGIITSLRHEVLEGVSSVEKGLEEVEQSVQLTNEVKRSLDAIIARATQSSDHASNTAQVIEKTVASNDLIQLSMKTVMEKTSDIRTEIEHEEQNLEHVVSSLENIHSMSEQVKQANIDQNGSAAHINDRMERFIKQLTGISEQTQQLQQTSDQIVDAMRKIDTITEQIMQNTTVMSEQTISTLVYQSGALRDGLNVFQVE